MPPGAGAGAEAACRRPNCSLAAAPSTTSAPSTSPTSFTPPTARQSAPDMASALAALPPIAVSAVVSAVAESGAKSVAECTRVGTEVAAPDMELDASWAGLARIAAVVACTRLPAGGPHRRGASSAACSPACPCCPCCPVSLAAVRSLPDTGTDSLLDANIGTGR
eukprot:scaffold31305_cov42-Phaeocystis_antarctica.AAC.1